MLIPCERWSKAWMPRRAVNIYMVAHTCPLLPVALVLQEQKTYEELRRVLQKAPGGSKHVANLQGIWGCYQDARRNTEAMAFRGHRLLDQVGPGAAGDGG